MTKGGQVSQAIIDNKIAASRRQRLTKHHVSPSKETTCNCARVIRILKIVRCLLETCEFFVSENCYIMFTPAFEQPKSLSISKTSKTLVCVTNMSCLLTYWPGRHLKWLG